MSAKMLMVLRLVILAPFATWTFLVLAYAGGFGGTPLTARLVGAALVAVAMMAITAWKERGWMVALGISLGASVFWAAQQPTNDRAWSEVAARTAWAKENGSKVTIHNVRNFRHNEDGTWKSDWYDETYDLAQLTQTYLVLTRFGGIEGLAHVMAAFEFADQKHVVLSVEIRREEGESYDPIGGALRQYELYYVAADERDAIALRTNAQKDETWVIPMNAGREKSAEFFLSMTRRMTKLHAEPEWYNTLVSSCASNLASHYEVVNNVKFPPDHRILLPGFSEDLLAELDLLPPGVTPAQARQQFQVNDLAQNAPLDANWSAAIRKNLPKISP